MSSCSASEREQSTSCGHSAFSFFGITSGITVVLGEFTFLPLPIRRKQVHPFFEQLASAGFPRVVFAPGGDHVHVCRFGVRVLTRGLTWRLGQ
ncbi:uncharacterized protein LACBIDRAFT_304387 [Laccaria bicolor S238N-H82]|uniref:Predicted protein n=1 Tax=Laccaria bicolor (strain S238N-H82 / ATCC MYA-4686) TaxID=486041 RepID=B0DLJ0_LACBS|nr:uncharacterized protein LACBIDRAFT_304387 [Laccaria bicolor S238N-H82]EDR04655.1 predicted protein [Laccaria bicolor S238N-H82]|eukprot:XP_001884827.1 predicted protein [Laccaria bicolor S238N-H82]